MSNYFKLFANCIPVKGIKRSTICDIQRNIFHVVPNDLLIVIEKLKRSSFEEVQIQHSSHENIFNEYIDFLIGNNLGFFGALEELQCFPEMNLEWDYPSMITNAIIDINLDTTFDIYNICKQLEELGCKDLQIRIFEGFNLESIKKVLTVLDGSRIINIELLCNQSALIGNTELEELCEKYGRLNKVTLFNCTEDCVVLKTNDFVIVNATTKLINADSCGNICPAIFNVSIDFFTEAQEHNTCLNRKVSIDVNGVIKNCPSMQKSYGNVSCTKIKDVVVRDEFQKLWFLNKDKIETCRDCEFRYICLDCRAYIKSSEDIYSKPIKCSYDPYTCEGFS